ncbi:hypothetical protein ES703_91532 [subsurface metagenome]
MSTLQPAGLRHGKRHNPDGDDPIPVDLEAALQDLGVIDHHWHSRWRVYPQDITQNRQLAAFATANTFGSWAEIIPLNTIPFDFDIIGFCVCQVSAVTSYFIQLGYNTINADPGANMELGERRFRIATHPIARATELLEIRSQNIPANARVMGRLKTASGAADTANVSVVLARHVCVSREVPLWPAFPW